MLRVYCQHPEVCELQKECDNAIGTSRAAASVALADYGCTTKILDLLEQVFAQMDPYCRGVELDEVWGLVKLTALAHQYRCLSDEYTHVYIGYRLFDAWRRLLRYYALVSCYGHRSTLEENFFLNWVWDRLACVFAGAAPVRPGAGAEALARLLLEDLRGETRVGYAALVDWSGDGRAPAAVGPQDTRLYSHLTGALCVIARAGVAEPLLRDARVHVDGYLAELEQADEKRAAAEKAAMMQAAAEWAEGGAALNAAEYVLRAESADVEGFQGCQRRFGPETLRSELPACVQCGGDASLAPGEHWTRREGDSLYCRGCRWKRLAEAGAAAQCQRAGCTQPPFVRPNGEFAPLCRDCARRGRPRRS